MTQLGARSLRGIMRDNTKGKTKAAIQTGKSIVKPVVIAGWELMYLVLGNFLLYGFGLGIRWSGKILVDFLWRTRSRHCGCDLHCPHCCVRVFGKMRRMFIAISCRKADTYSCPRRLGSHHPMRL
jgi:hypothetical protein